LKEVGSRQAGLAFSHMIGPTRFAGLKRYLVRMSAEKFEKNQNKDGGGRSEF